VVSVSLVGHRNHSSPSLAASTHSKKDSTLQLFERRKLFTKNKWNATKVKHMVQKMSARLGESEQLCSFDISAIFPTVDDTNGWGNKWCCTFPNIC
jgi:hypothetical protein